MKIFTKDGHLHVPEASIVHTTAPAIAADPKHHVPSAYCHNGHPLIQMENHLFDGQPGIELYCESEADADVITLSPFLGDPRRQSDIQFRPKDLLLICCPVCMNELPVLTPHDCCVGAQFIAVFLNDNGNINDSVGICSAWGCHNAFLHSYGEILNHARHDSVIPRC